MDWSGIQNGIFSLNIELYSQENEVPFYTFKNLNGIRQLKEQSMCSYPDKANLFVWTKD